MLRLQLLLTLSVLVQLFSLEPLLESGCRDPGVFRHPDDCRQFLICAQNREGTFVAETVPCPEGYSFSEPERTCVPSEQCKPSQRPDQTRVARASERGGCKMSGPYCDSCDRLLVCANMGEHGLTALANISCSDIEPDMSCSKASCTTQPAAATQACEDGDKAGTFHCLQPGFFPDPTDCKQFHVCGTDLSHFKGECDVQFDANRGICTSVDPADATAQTAGNAPSGTVTQQCKGLENPCAGVNTAPAKLPGYPSYYVICMPVATRSRKVPYVYKISVAKCPANQVFNDEILSCELSCSGRRGRFLDPDSCRSYIECSADTAVKKSCPENFAFDSNRKFCLPDSMVPGCQRTRSVEESSTTSSTTAPPATLTSTANTTQTIPTEGFRCRTTGAFADELDCRRFITCSLVTRSDGVYFRMRRRQCPFFTYFNRNGFCQLGFCWN